MKSINQFVCLVLILVAGFAWQSPDSNAAEPTAEIKKWCSDLSKAFADFRWKLDPCKDLPWKADAHSVEGRPLVYAEFGNPKATNTTLVFSMVHGDEITPLYLGIQLAHTLQNSKDQFKDTRVVIAPLVNPDGFFKKPRTRVNARGVDVNRNFDTKGWNPRALIDWKRKYGASPRRFPGNSPASEPETIFQVNLINEVEPQKILSLHSPLGFLDYDGPSRLTLSKFPTDYAKICEILRQRIKAISGGDYPGSLGNYAGQKGFPVITAELPSADPHKAQLYWKRFSPTFKTLINFVVPKYANSLIDKSESKDKSSGS